MTRLRLPLLLAGTVTGLLVAAPGLFENRLQAPGALPAGNVARVGDTLIPAVRYAALLDDLRADKRNPLSADDRRFALDRLIDEELLVQRGVELGFARDVPAVRKAIAAAVISQAVADASVRLPDEATLREFYESASAFFSSPSRLRLRWWRQDGEAAAALPSTQEIRRQLHDVSDPERLFERYGFAPVTELPDALLPADKLLNYIGPVLLEQAVMLQPGEFSAPVSAHQAVHFLYLIEKQPESSPPFESVREAVAQEYRYREGDRALREYLAWLRQRTSVIAADIAR